MIPVSTLMMVLTLAAVAVQVDGASAGETVPTPSTAPSAAPPTALPTNAPPAPAKEPQKEPKKADAPKPESPKSESLKSESLKSETPPNAGSQPAAPKSTKEAKPGSVAPAAKNKSESKVESKPDGVTAEGAKGAGKGGGKDASKTAVPPSEGQGHGPKAESSAPPASQDKTEPVPTKRPLGSNILTVKLAMLADPLLFPYDLEVSMDGDKAVLSGRVATEAEKQRAGDIAKQVDPVNTVINHLEVAKDLGAAMATRHDHALVQLVKERFQRSETLKSANFEVTCTQGIISLSGTVRFQVFALEAAQAARQVPGVRAVDTTHVQLTGEGKE